MVNVIPYTQTTSILCDHYITLRYPLDVTGIVENSGLGLTVNVKQVQLGSYKKSQIYLSDVKFASGIKNRKMCVSTVCFVLSQIL